MTVQGTDGPICFIESNTTGTGAELIRRAERLGPVRILARTPERYPFLQDTGAEIVMADTASAGSVLGALKDLDTVRAVCTTSDAFTAIAAEVARALGLPGPDPTGCRNCLDKARQMALLQEAGIRVPETNRLTATMPPSDLPVARSWIVKPITGSGSRGVIHCANRDEVRAAISGFGDTTGFLVQEFVPGPEYSVELFGDGRDSHVLGIVGKRVTDLPFRVETGHQIPAPLGGEVEHAITNLAVAATRALGLGTGFAHVEVILAESGPCIVEVNPRLAGGGIPFLLSAVSGRDVLEDWLSFILGLPRPSHHPPADTQGGAIAFKLADREGILDTIVHPPTRPDTILRVDTLKRPGDRIARAGDFQDRLISVTARGSGSEDALAIADAYLSEFVIKLVGAPENLD